MTPREFFGGAEVPSVAAVPERRQQPEFMAGSVSPEAGLRLVDGSGLSTHEVARAPFEPEELKPLTTMSPAEFFSSPPAGEGGVIGVRYNHL